MTDEIPYKNCRIQAIPDEIQHFAEYRPKACVKWSDGDDDLEEIVEHNGETCSTRLEAVQISYEIGKLYVDSKFG